jgi:hypothetical protein
MGVVRVIGILRWLPLVAASTACGMSTRDQAPTDEAEDAAVACGAASALCDVDRCADGTCSFVEIARVPGPVYSTRLHDEHVYVLGENVRTIFRVPKCGGTTSVVVRSNSSIGSFAVSGRSVYWTTNDTGGSRLFRSPGDGLGPTQEVSLAPTQHRTYVTLASDLTEAYALGPPPGLLRLEEDAVAEVGEVPAGAALLWDSDYFYFHSYGDGTRRVNKLDASASQLLEPGPLPKAVDEGGLYYSFWVPPAVADSRPAFGLFRLPKNAASAEALVYLEAAPAAVVADGRCAYVTLFGKAGSTEDLSTQRLRLDGREARVLFRSPQHHVTLDDAALYVTTDSGSIYRRPK